QNQAAKRGRFFIGIIYLERMNRIALKSCHHRGAFLAIGVHLFFRQKQDTKGLRWKFLFFFIFFESRFEGLRAYWFRGIVAGLGLPFFGSLEKPGKARGFLYTWKRKLDILRHILLAEGISEWLTF
ncbi:MAG: hypothetical protein ACLFUS_11000, partial [Candidatus Sumerlaeia bacterium]